MFTYRPDFSFDHPKKSTLLLEKWPVKLRSSLSHHESVSVWVERWSICVYVSASILHDSSFPPWWTGCLNPMTSRVFKCTDSSSYEAMPAQPTYCRLAIPAPNTPFLFLHPSQLYRIWKEERLHFGYLLQPQERPLGFEICCFLCWDVVMCALSIGCLSVHTSHPFLTR